MARVIKTSGRQRVADFLDLNTEKVHTALKNPPTTGN